MAKGRNHPKERKPPSPSRPWKAWEGRFSEESDPEVEQFTSSFAFDRRLFPYDIRGSIAHAEALSSAGLLTEEEVKTIVCGLKEVAAEGAQGDARDEDVHMYVERRLIEKVGEVGGKLHTGRSRNDQIALDLRLYLKEESGKLIGEICALQKSLINAAETHLATYLPGYTHLQRAQPISLAHYLLAYYEMIERDRARLLDSLKRMDQMPLGAGALAGNPFSIDRLAVARALGFSSVTANSLDAVSDRDFVVEFLSAASILMMHLSRWAEDWILWSSSEFRFIELPDELCTGSSMMPQKKNPDLLELIRGKTGRVYGALLTLLTVLKGLPLTYNRDLQEDKPPLFDTVDTLKNSLRIMTRLMGQVRFNEKRMADATEEDYLLATDLADYLVTKGLPFREAHRVVGKMVRSAIASARPFPQWALAQLQEHSPLFQKDVFGQMSTVASVAKRNGIGGTAIVSIQSEIRKIKRLLKKLG